MAQFALFQSDAPLDVSDKSLLQRATGRYYTHDLIATHLAHAALRPLPLDRLDVINLIEPFCGDGRLVCKLLEVASGNERLRELSWVIELWDSDAAAVEAAQRNVRRAAESSGIDVRVEATAGNSFLLAPRRFGEFTICLTNPPWEVLKPDRRELVNLTEEEAAKYISSLKEQDRAISHMYPLSSPRRKFSGWGTNLARSGVEAAFRLVEPGGVCGVVSPASLLADQMSERLRHWLFREHKITDIAYYAAEARLFEKVDQPSITVVAAAVQPDEHAPTLSVYDKKLKKKPVDIPPTVWKGLKDNGYVLPLQFGLSFSQLQERWKHLPRFSDLESGNGRGLWAGRELDETGHQHYLGSEGEYLFVKGRMIRRFGIVAHPTQYVIKNGPKVPPSANFYRLTWRDVARPNQKRRIHATIIPPGWVTGNSLHVAYFRDGDVERLKALLGVVNSLVFEAQVRTHLATGHISLGVVRQARIPPLTEPGVVSRLSELVDRCIAGDASSLITLEVAVARLYDLTPDDLKLLLSSFEKIESDEVSDLLSCKEWEATSEERA